MTTTAERPEPLSAFLTTISGFFVSARRPDLCCLVRLLCLYLVGLLYSKQFLKASLKLLSEMWVLSGSQLILCLNLAWIVW